jgi:guanylate kinase
MELEQGSQFDFQVVNDNIDKAIAEVDEIVQNNLKYFSNILIA